MIREEAIKELKEDIELYIPLHGTIDDVDRDLPDGRLITALEMGIKALEQEPKLLQALEQEKGAYNALVANMHCEDAISRSDMIDAVGHGTTYTSEELQRIIKALPPVNPRPCEDELDFMQPHKKIGVSLSSQPKTGHWIDVDGIWFKCSECDAHRKMMPAYKEYYCPNCGAKMIEPQESEG